ncbi:hypothetical protein LEMLEM_LOCUS25462, partial [Lemmus lemmus]
MTPPSPFPFRWKRSKMSTACPNSVSCLSLTLFA